MRFRLANLLIALMLVVALGLGSVAQSAMAAEMGPSLAAELTVPPDECDECGGDATMGDVICYAVCNSAASPSSPSLAAIGRLPQFETPIVRSQASWRTLPDPFPPKSHVLS